MSNEINDDDLKFIEKCNEVEKNILISFCSIRESLKDYKDSIKSSYFFNEKHSLFYELLVEIDNADNEEIDEITVKTEIKNRELSDILDDQFIDEMFYGSSSEHSTKYFIDLLINYHQRRTISDIAADLFSSVRTSDPDIGKIIATTQEQLNQVAAQETDIDFEKLKAGAIVIDVIKDLASENKKDLGVPSGFIRLDAVTNGFKPGELVIIAGRPAMGKSTFGMNIVEFAGYKNASNNNFNKPIVVFTLEMPSEQVMLRSISNIGTIDQKALQKKIITPEIEGRLTLAVQTILNTNNVYIDDSSYGLTVERVRSRVRHIAQQHPDPETGQPTMGLVLVDYLQLLESEQSFRDRHLLIAHIAKSLKALAREFNCPVLALSQLNRNVDTRGEDARPTNADLRESGAIEQDADIVIMVHRPEIAAKAEKKEELRGKAEIIITKNRQGEIGTLYCRFEGRYSRFYENDETHFTVG